MNKLTYRLGLDVGTNSLGWCVLAVDNNGDPDQIENCGVRIFPDGRDPKSLATTKADRRAARQARRRRDRFLQRQRALLSKLSELGLFPNVKDGQTNPVTKDELQQLQKLDPLQLRALGLSQKLPLHHIGRALFHLNQRRGFKSNRKDTSKDVKEGKVQRSINQLLADMQLMDKPIEKEQFKNLSKEEKKRIRQQQYEQKISTLEKLKEQSHVSYGAYLWQRRQNKLQTRARTNSDTKLFEHYPTREIYEDEFYKICTHQQQYYPDVLTADAIATLHKIIFYQRPLKPPIVGKCSFYLTEDRTFRAMPSYQRYRMYQEVNNLEWTDWSTGEKCKLIGYPQARDAIIDALEKVATKNGMLTFSEIKKIIQRLELGLARNITLNFEKPKRKGLEGNAISNLMQDESRIGDSWHRWHLEKQDELIALLLDDNKTDKILHKELIDKYQMEPYVADKCVSETSLPDGTAALSLKATRALTEIMKTEYCGLYDAIKKLAEKDPDFTNPYKLASDGKLLDELPYYGEAVKGHIIPGKGDELDEQSRIGMVSNPTVHIALNQIRQVVNELIKRYGTLIPSLSSWVEIYPLGRTGAAKSKKGKRITKTITSG